VIRKSESKESQKQSNAEGLLTASKSLCPPAYSTKIKESSVGNNALKRQIQKPILDNKPNR